MLDDLRKQSFFNRRTNDENDDEVHRSIEVITKSHNKLSGEQNMTLTPPKTSKAGNDKPLQ